MPIYEYKCSNCETVIEVMQKMSDAPITKCEACEQETMIKQVSAAGFILKGVGVYKNGTV